MKKSRSPDLTDEVLQQVLDCLDSWQGKLTWELLLEAIETKVGHRYSRFTFAEYPRIADAFALRKERLRVTLPRNRGEPKDDRLRAALAQVDRLKAKVDRLQTENDLLNERFVTWAINAERKGVTLDMLNAPLPKPARDRSKGIR